MTECEHSTPGEPEDLTTEPFDLRNPEHAELIPPEGYHLEPGESIGDPSVPLVLELPEILDGEPASTRGWGNPCSGTIVVASWRQPRGTQLKIPVESRVSKIVPALVDRLAIARGRDYAQFGTWGYDCRHIDHDPNKPWSNHAWGLAIDLEAPSNPRYSYTYGSHPHNAGAIARSLGFRWGGAVGLGGGYVSNYDCMHFEFMGTTAQAAYYAAHLTPTPEVDMPLTTADIAAVAAASAVQVYNRFTETSPDGRELNLQNTLERIMSDQAKILAAINPDVFARAVVAALPAGGNLDLAAIEGAVRKVLIEGTGGTP